MKSDWAGPEKKPGELYPAWGSDLSLRGNFSFLIRLRQQDSGALGASTEGVSSPQLEPSVATRKRRKGTKKNGAPCTAWVNSPSGGLQILGTLCPTPSAQRTVWATQENSKPRLLRSLFALLSLLSTFSRLLVRFRSGRSDIFRQTLRGRRCACCQRLRRAQGLNESLESTLVVSAKINVLHTAKTKRRFAIAIENRMIVSVYSGRTKSRRERCST